MGIFEYPNEFDNLVTRRMNSPDLKKCFETFEALQDDTSIA